MLDAQNVAVRGYLYCNLGIKVWSKCEHDYWADFFPNGTVYDSSFMTDDLMCGAKDPVRSWTFKEDVVCYDRVLLRQGSARDLRRKHGYKGEGHGLRDGGAADAGGLDQLLELPPDGGSVREQSVQRVPRKGFAPRL